MGKRVNRKIFLVLTWCVTVLAFILWLPEMMVAGLVIKYWVANHLQNIGGVIANMGTEAASIGIIGGADGPTAVFVTTRLSPIVVCMKWLISGVAILLWVIRARYKKMQE